MNGLNRRTGQRNRRYPCDSEYHVAPKGRGKARKPFYSSILTHTAVAAQKADHLKGGEAGGECDQSFPTTLDTGGLFMVSKEDSVAVLDTGAAANLVCSRLLGHHDQLLGSHGLQWLSTYPSRVTFRFRDGRLGEVRHATDTSGGSLGISASPPRLCWMQIFQRCCAKVPGRKWAGSRIFRAICWFYVNRGRQFR